MALELSDVFFAQIGGWEAVKRARGLVQQDRVLSSDWTPPLLKGIVQEGTTSFRAGLVIKSAADVENLCTCRASQEWGTMCAHSLAVGLHYLKGLQAAKEPSQPAKPKTDANKPAGRRLLRAADRGQGEAAEIFLILPPNLAEALARGKVMLCLEGKWRGGRAPLNALPANQFFSFSPADIALLDKIEALADGETPAMLMLKAEDFAGVLSVLVNHPRVSLGRSTPISVSNRPWSVPLRVELLSPGEIRLSLKTKMAAPVLIGEQWVFLANTFQPSALPRNYFAIFTQPITLFRADVPGFLSQDWPRLQAGGSAEANFQVEDFEFEPASPQVHLELKGGLAQLEAAIKCAYGSQVFAPATGENFWLPDPNSPTRYSTRNLDAEQAALDQLRRGGFIGPDAQGRYHLKGQNQVLNFFARDYPRWQRDWKITLEERLERSTGQNLERVEPRFQITPSGVQWFDLSVSFSAKDGERFAPADIQRLLLSGQGYTRLKNGKFALIDTGAVEELQEVLLDCAPQQHAQGYRLRSNQAGFLEATLREQGWQAQAPAAWRQQAQTESGQAKLECPPLGDLENVLRPYQKTGVAWLRFLRTHHFGGILADDMGLGKTVEVLAFVQNLSNRPLTPTLSPSDGERELMPLTPTLSPSDGERELIPLTPTLSPSDGERELMPLTPTLSPSDGEREKRGLPVLVVCPTSLVWNWVAEAQKFTPRLKVLALHGPDRHAQFAQIPQNDLVVTSYALVRRDAERYREFEFDTVVLDEAQHIKNRQTQNAQAVKSVRAGHHLVLTGTPMENSILDLWSIFDFLMPGYLGSAQDFRERYEIPITQGRNAAAQARLARRLRPFILRRIKKEVAPDLPPKIEQVSFCELTDEQRTVYQQLLDASRRELFEAVGAQGLARSRMVVLNALLRLRQVCCDLRLLKLEAAPPANASGKVALFNELLEEALDGGHRVLVFSQFVSMLTLLREELASRQIEFSYLDGSTTNRAEVVTRFQQSHEIPVFLISLKAGGVGLNLTGADTVIHFDPWWNPAVEDQATDRAHRIGQQRRVNSYKLITRGTVEEKILALQARKRELIQATLGSEEQLTESLTWDEIQELLGS